ncbi:MAG: hypothetical protein PUP92_24460, partial [Rhizonema sp. PD38]|nr:hypothetical protein [Rhizonema sp. PD38]
AGEAGGVNCIRIFVKWYHNLPSLFTILCQWVWTVLTVVDNELAMSISERPFSISLRTSCSRSVSRVGISLRRRDGSRQRAAMYPRN